MYREALRSCPWCGSLMTGFELPRAKGTLERCDHCSGFFFDFADGTPARLARALRRIEPALDATPLPEPQPRAECSRCGRAMRAHRQIADVLCCRGCGSVFSPAASLRRLSLGAALL